MTIHELFEKQARMLPDSIAVSFGDKELTYQQLNDKANQLANYLRNNYKIVPDTLIAICMERSLEVVIGILGILKAGGAYVPIDPDYPKDRIKYMLHDSQAKLFLTQKKFAKNLACNQIQSVILDRDWSVTNKESRENPKLITKPHNLAYVIYTSGSTGKPKGVMIEHKNLVNFITSMQKEFRLDEKDKLLAVTSISFDISNLEIYLPLVQGACCVVAPKEATNDGLKLKTHIDNLGITIMQATPATWQMLLAAGWQPSNKLKILCGGEALSSQLAQQLTKKKNEIWNLYGPTETTIWSTVYRFNATDNNKPFVLIGKPISNTQLYILDENLNTVPINTPGELYIEGAGLARGYLNQPELTKERFITNPFSNKAQSRLYKTGDLVRQLPDKNIEFLGRIDHQVKIRGFRIELGEIESTLNQHKNIKQSVVIAHETNSQKQLVAYYVKKGFEKTSPEMLRRYLSKYLPNYMVPAIFVKLEKIPLTPNRKIDRKALPNPNLNLKPENYVAPRNEEEKTLAAIWSKNLKIDNIGIHDNFFSLGGHSLNATQVILHINHVFKIDCSIKALFDNPTIAQLAKILHSPLNKAKNIKQPITRIDRKQALPLSFAQQRIWFLAQYEQKQHIIYNIPIAIKLTGKLDQSALEKSFNYLIQRHESFRTQFIDVNGIPQQKIIAKCTLKLQPESIKKQELNNILTKEAILPFDLTKAPLIRIRLLKIDTNEYVLIINQHHIISDGWSMEIFINELNETYKKYIDKQTPKLTNLDIQYADFAHWQKQKLQDNNLKKQLAYWDKNLANFTNLQLPTDLPRPVTKTYHGKHCQFALNKKLTDNLKTLAKTTHTTLYMVLLAAFNVLLNRYSNQEDIIIGSPIANRNHPAIENIIGFFVNTLALRNNLAHNPTFTEFLKRVKHTCLEAYANQDVPFNRLVELLKVPRDISQTPIFQVMFVLENANEQETLTLPNLQTERLHFETNTAKFDLTLFLSEEEGGLAGVFEYNTDLYYKATIKRMLQHYINMLQEIVKHPTKEISKLKILSQQEYQQIVIDWNKTERDYPEDKTIQQLFEEQVEKTPDNIAVIFEGKKLTYKKLNSKSNQLARYIRKQYKLQTKQELQPDTLIALCLNRSHEMIIAILAILKAGGAYVPIVPDYPIERIKYILKDANTHIVITQNNLRQQLKALVKQIKLVSIDNGQTQQKLEQLPTSNLKQTSRANDLAYVIYTSGTTGKPKGVLITQKNVVNYIYNINDGIINHSSRIDFSTSIAFDLSVTTTLGAILNGKTIVIYNEDAREISKYIEHITINQVDTLKLAPSYAEQLFLYSKNIPSLKTLIVGGEKLNKSQSDLFKKTQIDYLFDEYGPTETTVGITATNVFSNLDAGIGKPTPNVKVYICNRRQEVVPIGVIGELYIGGAGLARGYLNQPKLSAEKFIPNPFTTEADKAKGYTRLYKTGDLVRWLPNGNIEYIERIDDQVKIRGFRIELGEIESILNQYRSIKQGVVIVKETDGQKYLITYYVEKDSEEKITSKTLRQYLGKYLPDYMIPTIFVKLDKIPLTPNGKIDRKALLEHRKEDFISEKTYIAPRTKEEKILTNIWEEVLKLKKIGICDNFFEIGGHSLKATRVISRIDRAFHIHCPIKALFENPTIEQLADLLYQQLNNKKIITKPISRINRKQQLTLSFAQERLWFLDQYEQHRLAAYNIPIAIKLTGKLDKLALEKSLNYLIQRHESFRTQFVSSNGVPQQKIISKYTFKLQTRIILKKQLDKILIDEATQPFDLTKAPLIRISLLKINRNEHVLIINQHHIISDAWSLEIFIKELNESYSKYITGQTPKLPHLRIQYADFANWQKRRLKTGKLKKQLAYWQHKLANFSDLQLPTDLSKPSVKTYNGKHHQFTLNTELTQNLKDLAQATNTTLFMVLLTIFNVLLNRYSNQEDIMVGSPIANRNHPDIENITGFFVNTLSLRNDLSNNPPFIELLEQVKHTCLEAYANQDIPFDHLVDKLKVARDVSRTPLFQVMFILQANKQDTLTLLNLQTELLHIETNSAKFDLIFDFAETIQGLTGTIEYNSDLFYAQTIARMARHFITLVQSIITDAGCAINSLPILTQTKQKQILNNWSSGKQTVLRHKTINTLFEEQVNKSPNNIAVVYENQKLTYQQLNNKANQLARYLRKQCKITPNTAIAICMERGLEMIIGILGILKTGGVYVPIDPTFPKDRINYMLQDSQSKFILTKITEKNISKEAKTTPKIRTQPNDLAYVIYTSGSTGKPKGVMINHQSVVNRIIWMQAEYQLTAKEKYLHKTPFTFDVSVGEILWPLSVGARLIIASPEGHKSLSYLMKIIKEQSINNIHFVPSMLTVFIDEVQETEQQKNLNSLKRIFCSGENLSTLLASRVSNLLNVTIHNLYGPTETGEVTAGQYDPKKHKNHVSVPIGKPIYNTSCYILDNNMNPVPAGIPGKLYLGGISLATGYLNQPSLTTKSFITSSNYGRIYNTGDIVKWLADGNIEFIGRDDSQVKVRGIRVELGEIEAILNKHSNIKQSVIIAKEINGQKQLIAYYVEKDSVTTEPKTLQQYLAKRLPDHMIPAIFVKLKEIPLTPNGKINHKALLNRDTNKLIAKKTYIAPQTKEEKFLAKTWKQILKLKQVGISDNFFQVGGNSLLAIRLVAKIDETLNKNISITDIFKYPTIKELMSSFNNDEKTIHNCVLPLREQGNKQPLFLIHGIAGNGNFYKNLVAFIPEHQPVYVINNPYFGQNKRFSSLKQMAAYYVEVIASIQKNGTYQLGGWCFGGNVALEIATQLEKKGCKVNIVIFKNTFNHDRLRQLLAPHKKIFANWYKTMVNKTQDNILNQMKQELKNKNLKLTKEEEDIFKQEIQWNIKLLYKHKVQAYDGKIALITGKPEKTKVIDEFMSPKEKQLNYWHGVLTNVKTYATSIKHFAFFSKTNAPKLALLINNILGTVSDQTKK